MKVAARSKYSPNRKNMARTQSQRLALGSRKKRPKNAVNSNLKRKKGLNKRALRKQLEVEATLDPAKPEIVKLSAAFRKQQIKIQKRSIRRAEYLMKKYDQKVEDAEYKDAAYYKRKKMAYLKSKATKN